MFRLDAELRVYLHRDPVDFRLGINGPVCRVFDEAEQDAAIEPVEDDSDGVFALPDTGLPQADGTRASETGTQAAVGQRQPVPYRQEWHYSYQIDGAQSFRDRAARRSGIEQN